MHRYAYQATTEARLHLRIIHAIPVADHNLPTRLDLADHLQSEKRREVRERIDAMQKESVRMRRFAWPSAE